jgi:ABC-type nickel/cobalt efflux system permease component RcnA
LLTLDGHGLVLEPVSQQVIFPQGAGNLPTMKMGFVYRARLPESCRGTACELSYNDSNFPGRAGWKEIVVSALPGVHRADGAGLSVDRSSRLTDYPTDLVNSPPQDVSAKIAFTVAAPVLVKPRSEPVESAAPQPVVPRPVELQPNRQAPPRNAFTELMTRKEISFGFALIAALIAAGLGALHAMEPGHGKTIVAAYLVGSKGTGRHAVLLGLIVTVSHTAGVYLLGAVTLYAQKYIMPDRLYPFLSVISGILIAGMGIYILLKRMAGEEFASHVHGPSGHSHGVLLEKIGKKQLLILGVTGGMVPCPAALVVLLSAVALHRVGFGLFLIVAFSMGLAAVLIGMGLAAVYAGRLISRVPMEGRLIRLWMPAASAAMITILGFAIAIRGLMAAGIVQIRI